MPYTCQAGLRTLRKILQPPPAPRQAKHEKQPTYPLPSTVEEQVVAAFQRSLLDFYGACTVRQMHFTSYLQPVLLPHYYPSAQTDKLRYPSIDYFSINFFSVNRHWNRFQANHIIPTTSLYGKAEKMYADLEAQHPGHFTNLISLFSDGGVAVQEAYNQDAIHYEQKGKKKIAQSIIADLIAKGALGAKQGTQPPLGPRLELPEQPPHVPPVVTKPPQPNKQTASR